LVQIRICGGIHIAQDRFFMHSCLFRVRQYECDAYGHLNNVNYVRYLQEAIAEADAASDYTLARSAAAGWRWQTRRLDIEYLRPTRYGDTVELQVSAPGGAAGFVRRACEFRLTGSGDLVAQATVEAVSVDAVSDQPVELPLALQGERSDPIAALPSLPPPPPGVFSVRHRVTWNDLDMTRHVGDATLLEYVEACGFGVIAAHGWPPERMAAQSFAIILRRHQIENPASAALDDEVEFATWASDVKRVMSTRHYTIRRVTDGTLLTRVDTLGVWVDLTSGRPIRIPPDFLADFAPNLVG
jgi:acyl-CoA thioester hydrolase